LGTIINRNEPLLVNLTRRAEVGQPWKELANAVAANAKTHG
jgi:hypothetical protein